MSDSMVVDSIKELWSESLNLLETPIFILKSDLSLYRANTLFYESTGLSVELISEIPPFLSCPGSRLKKAVESGVDQKTFLASKEKCNPFPIAVTAVLNSVNDKNGNRLGYFISAVPLFKLDRKKTFTPENPVFKTFFFDNQAIMLLINPEDHNILAANQAALDFYGYNEEDIESLNMLSLHDDAGPHIYRNKEIFPDEGYSFSTRHKTSAGILKDVVVYATPLKLSEMTVVLLIIHDMTRTVEIGKELEENEKRLGLAMEGSGLGLWDWNLYTGNVHFDRRWYEIIGYEPEELNPVSIETWRRLTHPLDLERAETLLQKCFSSDTDLYECELRMRHKNGNWVWILDRGKVFERADSGESLRMLGTHMDITERKKSEFLIRGLGEVFEGLSSKPLKNIRRMVEKACTLLDGDFAVFCLWDSSIKKVEIIESWNLPDKYSLNQPGGSVLSAGLDLDRSDTVTVISDLFNTEYRDTDSNVDNLGLRSYIGYPVTYSGAVRGNICVVSDTPRVYNNMEEYCIAVLGKSLGTEADRLENRKKLRTSEERYRSYFDNTPLCIWEEDFSQIFERIRELNIDSGEDLEKYLDENPDEIKSFAALVKVIEVNPATIGMYGAQSKEDLFWNLPDVFTEDTFDAFRQFLIHLYKGESDFRIETYNKTLKGEILEVELRGTFLSGYRVLVSIQNISELKQNEKRLAELLNESRNAELTKEILIREINHRVKNNLSAITGMLYLELTHAEAREDSHGAGRIKDFISRIRCMGVAHNLISLSAWSGVNLKKLTEKIIYSIAKPVFNTENFKLEISDSEIKVFADYCYTLSAVINEIFTNFLKYGIENNPDPVLTIDISENDGRVSYIFRDNGTGFADEVLKGEGYKIGLGLASSMLFHNMKGNLTLDNDGGAVVSLDFPAEGEISELL